MPEMKTSTQIVIMGAAGRDFHNFNVVFKEVADRQVIAFTAAQITGISGRNYPPALAGSRYPDGIPIVPEEQLADLCREQEVTEVVFAYSDVTHSHVMHQASVALSVGADFTLLGPKRTKLRAKVPVIAVCAVRTGCGKSQVTRWLSFLLKEHGLKVAVVRHPMPYGDLELQAVQRFARQEDLKAADCTIEEREEYEPHLALGNVVYAGVDYAAILMQAEAEADIILWDGGNNDFPFFVPDLHVVLVDPLRPGHETTHHPGEAVLRMADVVLVAKANSASDADVQQVSETAHRINPAATIVRGASPVILDDPELVRGRRVLVVEDGPTITHGGMAYGAGYVRRREPRRRKSWTHGASPAARSPISTTPIPISGRYCRPWDTVPPSLRPCAKPSTPRPRTWSCRPPLATWKSWSICRRLSCGHVTSLPRWENQGLKA